MVGRITPQQQVGEVHGLLVLAELVARKPKIAYDSQVVGVVGEVFLEKTRARGHHRPWGSW